MNYMESKKKLDELRRGNVKEKMDRCINKAISYVEDLIDLYDSNTEITDIIKKKKYRFMPYYRNFERKRIKND